MSHVSRDGWKNHNKSVTESLVLALVGVQNNAYHAAENTAHGEEPPGGAPGVPGQTQTHLNGGGGEHDPAAEGTDEAQAALGLRGGVVVPVVLPDLVFVLLHPAVDKGEHRAGDQQQKDRTGQGFVWLPNSKASRASQRSR